MAVSDRDRRAMRRLGEASKALDRETGWGSPETRAEVLAIANAVRRLDGRPALKDDDVPDELGFHERAVRLGLVRRPPAAAR